MQILGNYTESLLTEDSEEDIFSKIVWFLGHCDNISFESNSQSKTIKIRFAEDILSGTNYRYILKTTSSQNIYTAEINTATNNLATSQTVSSLNLNTYVGSVETTFLYGSAGENFLDLSLINKYNRIVYWSVSLNTNGPTNHSVMNNGIFKDSSLGSLFYKTGLAQADEGAPLALYNENYYSTLYMVCNNLIFCGAAETTDLYKNTNKDPVTGANEWYTNYNSWHCFKPQLLNRVRI